MPSPRVGAHCAQQARPPSSEAHTLCHVLLSDQDRP